MAFRKIETALSAPENDPLKNAIVSAVIEHLEKRTHGDAPHNHP
jgi:hypothetical protein